MDYYFKTPKKRELSMKLISLPYIPYCIISGLKLTDLCIGRGVIFIPVH